MKKALMLILGVVTFASLALAAEIHDSVKKLRDDDEGTVVTFAGQKTMFYLKKENKKFDEIRKKLQSVQGKKTSVHVTVDAQQTILEVK